MVLGVNMEDIRLAPLAEFAEDMFVSYPVLRSRPKPMGELGRVTGLPTTYIVSPEGKLVAWQGCGAHGTGT